MVEHGTFTGNRDTDYPMAVRQAALLWEADLPLVSNLANIAALVAQCLPRTNWAGFYLWDEARRQLLLGPFQGLPACTRIDFGKGVCGTALRERRTQRVADVHEFPGHIACDSASASEIVVPILRGTEVLGVLDVDSPEKSRFDATDQAFLEEMAATLITRWPG
jgi:L-methionine (R)-S-oxide reductase